MLASDRRDQLLAIVRQRGFASLPELASELEVSESTVRRDLELLEQGGNAKRTHGGVFYTGDTPQFPHFRDRQSSQWNKKQAIAQRMAELIDDGDTVLLDGGSTTYEVARLLAGRPLQVVTNSMPVANLLASNTNIDLVILGGYVHSRSGTTMGPYAKNMLEQINVRKAILSVAAINEEGLYNSNVMQVETQQSMIAAADEVAIVADSTKFGHRSLTFVCKLNEIERMVVDNDLSDDWKQQMRSAGIDLQIASEVSSMDPRPVRVNNNPNTTHEA